MAKYTCKKCGRVMDEAQFYTYKTGGKTELCKKCLTMHANAFDESTFKWILEKMDVPYVPAEWNTLRDKDYNEKGASKFSTMAVMGKYLSKMKLKQWKEYGYADSARLIEEAAAAAKAREETSAEQYEFYKALFDEGKISEAEFKTFTTVADRREEEEQHPDTANPYLGPDNPYDEQKFMSEEELPDPAAQLTEEDKIYLAMKWGRLYTPTEWLALEKDYTEMANSFSIVDPDSKNTLMLLCKTNLKSNQAIDNGDIESFQKLAKVSESLRKTANLTAAQNKKAKGDIVDSIGQLVELCEKQGFIPRYVTDVPQDKVDLTLQDMNNYLNKLVTQDLGFGKQIEDSLKKIMLQKEMNEAADQDDVAELQDEDFKAFYEEKESQIEEDEEMLRETEDGGEE